MSISRGYQTCQFVLDLCLKNKNCCFSFAGEEGESRTRGFGSIATLPAQHSLSILFHIATTVNQSGSLNISCICICDGCFNPRSGERFSSRGCLRIICHSVSESNFVDGWQIPVALNHDNNEGTNFSVHMFSFSIFINLQPLSILNIPLFIRALYC